MSATHYLIIEPKTGSQSLYSHKTSRYSKGTDVNMGLLLFYSVCPEALLGIIAC